MTNQPPAASASRAITLVVSETPVIIRQLHWPGFRRLDLSIHIGRTGDDLVELVGLLGQAESIALIVQSRVDGDDGFEIVRRCRQLRDDLPAIVIKAQGGGFPELGEEQRAAFELLSAPLPRGELYKVLTPLLGLPTRINLPAHVMLEAPGSTDPSQMLTGELTNLAVSGARMILPKSVEERMRLTLELRCSAGSAKLPGRVIWSRSRSPHPDEANPHARPSQPARKHTITGEAEVSVQFLDISEETREFLRTVTSWESTIDEQTGEQRIQLLRGLTEMSDLTGLSGQVADRVVIDLSLVNVVYSVGVTRWVKFLRQIPQETHYRFINCSTAFCLEGSAFEDLFGRGEVTSVYAPYCCTTCAYEAERLIEIAALDTTSYPPVLPTYECPWCPGRLQFDDLPERYFGFLRPVE